MTGTAGSLTLSYDQAGHLPGALTPVDSDWQFVGWQIGSTVYAAGSTAKNLTDVDGKTVTATAVWQVKGFSGQSYQVVLHNGTESQVLTAYFGKAFTPSVSVQNALGGVTVSWGSVKGAKSYVVYRKAAGGSWQRIATTTAVKYTDTKATKGALYSYTVRAVAGTSLSDYKASSSVTVLGTPSSSVKAR